MASDPIVAEIHAIREAIAARFNYDLHAIWKDAAERTNNGDRPVVTLPPRPVTEIPLLKKAVAINTQP